MRKILLLLFSLVAVIAASIAFNGPIGSAATGTGFLETFDGDPSEPQRLTDPNWDVSIMTRDRASWVNANAGNIGDHGPDCGPPPQSHAIEVLEDMVFQCKNHLMTAMNDDGFGVVTLTPNQLLDLQGPEAKVSFDLSTQRTGGYDWVEVVLTPFEDNLVHPAKDVWEVAGPAENSIAVAMNPGGQNRFLLNTTRDGVAQRYDNVDCPGDCAGVDHWTEYGTDQLPLVPDKKRRETFELTLTDDGKLSFGVVDYFDGTDNDQSFYWLDEVDVGPIDWDAAVVQLQHFTFNPTNNCGDPTCDADSWHWDNVAIEPAISFSTIASTERFIDPTMGSTTMTFTSPSGNDAFLRFSAIGDNVEVSTDGGSTWAAATLQKQSENDPRYSGRFRNYFHPIPAGVDEVQFRSSGWWGGSWHARDMSIWSRAAS